MRGIAPHLNKIRAHGRKGFLNVTILNSRQFIQAQLIHATFPFNKPSGPEE